MHPGRIAGYNVTYTEPDDWDRKVHGTKWPLALHARRIPAGASYHIETAWFPTLQEIDAMCWGAPVYLMVAGERMPAATLSVGKPADKLAPLPRATHVARSMLGNRAVTVVFEAPPTDEQIQLLKQHLSGASK